MKSASLGVLGGMGPLATADFLAKLTLATPAGRDQEHIPVVVWGDCTTPDRTESILGRGESPLQQLLAGIEFLNRAGCRAIAIPCNSAHAWWPQMQAASSIPVLHIVRASAEKVRRNDASTRRVGVLSTEGTHRMGIYREALEELGFDVIAPTGADFQELVSPGIADIKGNRLGDAEAKFDTAADRLFERGAGQIIMGCTEIPLGMQQRSAREPRRIVDSTQALVDAVLAHFERTPQRQASPAATA